MDQSSDPKTPKTPEDNSPIQATRGWWPKLLGRKSVVIGALVFVLLAGILLAFSSKYSLVKVNFAGQSLGNTVSRQELQAELDSRLQSYKVSVSQDGELKEFSLAQVGISVETGQSADAAYNAKMPKSPLKRLMFWNKSEVPLKLSVDDKVLDSFIAKNLVKTSRPAKNASLRIEEGKLIAVKEEKGSATTLDNPEGSLLRSIESLQNAPLVLKLHEVEPAIKIDDTKKARKTAEELMAKNINFKIGTTVVRATPADIGKWLELSPVKSAATIDLTLNSGKVLEYLNMVATPYVQPPRNAILIPSSAGQKRTLIPGQNGSDVLDKEAIAARVAKDIFTKESITETLTVKYQTFKTISATAHNKWLAVDLTNKRMYVYEKTKLVKTFLVSAGAPETPTVSGTYKIYRKLESQDMTGANTDGSRYFQAGVRYVNYFHADYAIHGNHWRPLSYFGNINSSHGCVGIVNSDAEWIYNWAPVGTTVLTFS